MKKAILLTLATVALSIPLRAVERHQSYISYDDGGTIVRSAADGREVEASRNLPVYPDDEIVTPRRGRAEVRLSDGNIIGIDRATSLRLVSILDSFEGDADETVAQLRFGKVAVFRTDRGRDHVRLDTDNASYLAEHEGIYSVETDSRGRDRVVVFEGSVEVRTPRRASRLRAGEAAWIDDRGIADLVSGQIDAADDFEDWFLARAERLSRFESRYVDRRVSYYSDDLDDHGRWVFISGMGWSWRPYVAVGWRPYYHGYWHRSRWGSLVWVSYDPWGWAPYHYGRWAYDPVHSWVWFPGSGYSPAWVYWMYGSGYVGWAPSGWWDCYRPYYNWAYRPSYSAYDPRPDFNFGFYGRIRVNEMDLRPWTFVDSRGLISTRADRAALTIDAVKHRLGGGGGYAAVSGTPARFTNEEVRDPAEAIRRRSIEGREGRLTGRETGAPGTVADLTPFFRRDGQLSGDIRDRVVRARGGNSTGNSATARGGGGLAPIGGGSVAPIDGGSVAPTGAISRGRGGDRGSVGGGTVAEPSTGSRGSGGSSNGGTIRRGNIGGGGSRGTVTIPPATSEPVAPSGRTRSVGRGIERPQTEPGDEPASNWRGRSSSGSGSDPGILPPSGSANSGSVRGGTVERGEDNWRGRTRAVATPRGGSSDSGQSTTRSHDGGSDVPRRVIERIGGARITPRSIDSGTSHSTGGRSAPSGERSRPSRVESSGGSRSNSGSSGGGSMRSSGGNSGGSAPSTSAPSGGSGRAGGGQIRRDEQ